MPNRRRRNPQGYSTGDSSGILDKAIGMFSGGMVSPGPNPEWQQQMAANKAKSDEIFALTGDNVTPTAPTAKPFVQPNENFWQKWRRGFGPSQADIMNQEIQYQTVLDQIQNPMKLDMAQRLSNIDLGAKQKYEEWSAPRRKQEKDEDSDREINKANTILRNTILQEIAPGIDPRKMSPEQQALVDNYTNDELAGLKERAKANYSKWQMMNSGNLATHESNLTKEAIAKATRPTDVSNAVTQGQIEANTLKPTLEGTASPEFSTWQKYAVQANPMAKLGEARKLFQDRIGPNETILNTTDIPGISQSSVLQGPRTYTEKTRSINAYNPITKDSGMFPVGQLPQGYQPIGQPVVTGEEVKYTPARFSSQKMGGLTPVVEGDGTEFEVGGEKLILKKKASGNPPSGVDPNFGYGPKGQTGSPGKRESTLLDAELDAIPSDLLTKPNAISTNGPIKPTPYGSLAPEEIEFLRSLIKKQSGGTGSSILDSHPNIPYNKPKWQYTR